MVGVRRFLPILKNAASHSGNEERRVTPYLIIMYRPRNKLITPLNTVIIDHITPPQSDIEEDSSPNNQMLFMPSFKIPTPVPSLLSSIKIKPRVQPHPHFNSKKETINIDREPLPPPSPLSYHSISESSPSLYSLEQSSSLVMLPQQEKDEPPKKRLKRMSMVPNKVKLEKRDETSIQCSICLSDLKNSEQRSIGKLGCGHLFCFKCIMQSSRFATKCPYCRAPYRQIFKGKRVVTVPEVVPTEQLDDPMDEPCYICGRNDDYERLLQCQYCEYAYCHTYCDTRLNSSNPPSESWYCLSCQQLLKNQEDLPQSYDEIYQQQS